MEELGHPVFDADNHYYEAEDAFTRHLDPALGPRCVQWATIDGRKYHVIGGRGSRAASNASVAPASPAGSPSAHVRGTTPDGPPPERPRGPEPSRPRDPHREPRLRTP